AHIVQRGAPGEALETLGNAVGQAEPGAPPGADQPLARLDSVGGGVGGIIAHPPRSAAILAAYSAGPPVKVAVPATKASAPAAIARGSVSRSIPPSTSRSIWRPEAVILCRSAAILASCDSMNFCPPKPGLTLITSTRSIRSMTLSTASTGVAG